jgi:tetratricopeptide (TPR) repeat protein
MFKLLNTFFDNQSDSESSDSIVPAKQQQDFESQLQEAERLCQQGKLNEAITIDRQAIEQIPHSLPTQQKQKLSIALQQQNNLAEAYEQLATAYKQQGEVDRAANYYRQAIVLKALNGNKDSLKLSSQSAIKRLLKEDNLLDSAFTFQPSAAENSGKLKNRSIQIQLQHPNSYFPLFSGAVDKINSQQTVTIGWEAAQVYLQQALDFCDRQNWQQAAIACKQATQLHPNLAEAYKIWGNALQRMGKTAEAMDCYAKAVEIQPDLAEVYAKVASLYVQQQKWQQAVEYYQKAIIIKPNFTEAYHSLAQIWQLLGDSEKAQVYQSRVLELEKLTERSQATDNFLNPKLPTDNLSLSQSVETYQEIAKNLEQQEKWQEAAQYYRKALELELSQSKLLSNHQPAVNSTKNSQKNTQLARLRQVQQLLKQGTENSANNTNLLTSSPETNQAGTRQIDKAIERYEKQAQLKPDSAKIQLDLGNLYAKQRQWSTAITCYHKAIKINSQYAEAYWHLAQVLEKIGKTSESLERRYQALTLKPGLAPASDHVYLGNLLQEKGKLEQAIICYRQAIALKPKLLPTYYNLGEILSSQGKKQEAISLYRQAIQYNPDDAQSYYLLGQEFAGQKQWNQAVQAYRRVLELQPTFPKASHLLNHALAEKLKLDLQKNI